MNIRLAMCGPSGTGKTTLSQYVADKYDIPFITTSTKPLWDKYGINSHAELINKTLGDPMWGINFQNEVLTYRLEKLQGKVQFVTDRSPVDNLVYFLLQNTHLVSQDVTENYITQCKLAMDMFNGLICLPFTNEIPLENDGARITNKYYQMVVNDTFKLASYIMGEPLSKIPCETITKWDMQHRRECTDQIIQYIQQHEG